MSEDGDLSLVVGESLVGSRADKALAALYDDFSRARLQKLIDEGAVRLNGAVLTAASTKVVEGDVFEVIVPEPVAAEPVAQDIPLDVVYEDDDLLVINKPVGLVVHPGAGNWEGTMVNALLHHCGDSLSGIGGVLRPGIVHRLDKDTSGLMVVAKNDHAHHFLSEQLADRSLSRVYLALVVDVPVPIKGVIDRPLARDKKNCLKMAVAAKGGKEARTHYHMLEAFGQSFALVECKLETGRTHQIRVHMQSVGCPIVGDPLYGAQPTKVNKNIRDYSKDIDLKNKIESLQFQLLHATAISFIHPSTEEVMEFQVDMPESFAIVLDALREVKK